MTKRITFCSMALTLTVAAHAQQPAAPAKTAPTKASTAAQSPAKAPSKTAAKSPAKAAPAKAATAAAIPSSQKEKFSYALGTTIGQNLKSQPVEVDLETLLRGVRDAHAGAKLLLSEQEMTDAMNRARQEAMAKQQEQQKGAGEKNKREGDAFLAQNKARAGVTTLPSGLQCEELKPGTGAMPKATDTVTTHYRGTLIDGTEFDSSYKRNEPASFAVTGVIRGWTEALQLMKVGAKWKLYIPASLAYGEQQRGPVIGPNSVLVFEIELLAIKDAAAPK